MRDGLTTLSTSRLAGAFLACAAVYLFAPEIANAAVAFGEIGENVAENAKGIAKGAQFVGFAGGVIMAVLGITDMYNICNLLPK